MPLQVKLANSRAVGDGDAKLFVGMLPKTMDDAQIESMFGLFGPITEIHMIRDQGGNSRGCAFVKFEDRASAVRAIEEVNLRVALIPGRAVTVKFADKRNGNKGGNTMAPAPPLRGPSNGAHFYGATNGGGGGGYGAYAIPNALPMPYGAPPPPPHTLLAPPLSPLGAQQIQYAYAPQNQFFAAPSPYHVDMQLQQQQLQQQQIQQQQLQGIQYVPVHAPAHSQPAPYPFVGGYSSGYSVGYGARVEGGHHLVAPSGPPPPPQAAAGAGGGGGEVEARPVEGPSGANLFIYHLPHDLTDADLATLFGTSLGHVLSAKVYLDKRTGESKGFGKRL